MKKIVIGCMGLLLLSGSCKKNEPAQQETLRVSVETVTSRMVNESTPYVGVVEEEQSTAVSFTGMAAIKTLRVSEGQPVKRGQLLAAIDDTQARNALSAAKAALDQAQDAEARMKKLHEAESLPEMKWVEVESKVKQAQASLDMCVKNLEECSSYAPCSGVVGSKIMGVGETVLPSEPVLTILSIDRVKVRVSVPEKEIAAITPKTASRVTVDALPGQVFLGNEIEKGVSADAMTHSYDIRIRLDNPGHQLLPGMVAKVTLQSPEEQPRLSLPVKAVQQGSDGRLFVWVVDNGKAQRRIVTVGNTIGNRIVVDNGLQEGEQVIVEGYQKVSDMAPVATEEIRL